MAGASCGAGGAGRPPQGRAGISIVRGNLKVFVNDPSLVASTLQALSALDVVGDGAHVESALASLATHALRIIAAHTGRHYNSLHAAIHAVRLGVRPVLRKRLEALNQAHTFLRHFTELGAQGLLADLRADLAATHVHAPGRPGSDVHTAPGHADLDVVHLGNGATLDGKAAFQGLDPPDLEHPGDVFLPMDQEGVDQAPIVAQLFDVRVHPGRPGSVVHAVPGHVVLDEVHLGNGAILGGNAAFQDLIPPDMDHPGDVLPMDQEGGAQVLVDVVPRDCHLTSMPSELEEVLQGFELPAFQEPGMRASATQVVSTDHQLVPGAPRGGALPLVFDGVDNLPKDSQVPACAAPQVVPDLLHPHYDGPPTYLPAPTGSQVVAACGTQVTNVSVTVCGGSTGVLAQGSAGGAPDVLGPQGAHFRRFAAHMRSRRVAVLHRHFWMWRTMQLLAVRSGLPTDLRAPG